jgi:hypothetical protein
MVISPKKRNKPTGGIIVMPKRGLYDNINRRKKKGISRTKKKSTIDPKTYDKMKKKKGGFAPKKKKSKATKRRS